MKSSALRLSPEEFQLKRLVQEVLVKNQVLSSRSEHEWNAFATRRLLQDFLKILKPAPVVTVRSVNPGAKRPGREQPRKNNGETGARKAPVVAKRKS